MKKLLVLTLTLSVSYSLTAQTTTAKPKTATKPVSKPVAKPATPKPAAPVLKNLNDSASYAIGMSVANFYKEQGITNINTTILSNAIKDVLGSKKLLIDEYAGNLIMNKLMMKVQEDKAKGNIDACNNFMAKNKLRPEVKTTATGLQYEVITEGTGAKLTAIDTFVCHYRGTLLDGTEFDASYNRGTPLVMPANQVIKGWTEGLQLMSVGSKYKFYIPYTLGYGTFDNGAIPGGSALIFEVELLDVKKAKTE